MIFEQLPHPVWISMNRNMAIYSWRFVRLLAPTLPRNSSSILGRIDFADCESSFALRQFRGPTLPPKLSRLLSFCFWHLSRYSGEQTSHSDGRPSYSTIISSISSRLHSRFAILKLSTVSRRIEPFASRCEYSQTVWQKYVRAVSTREKTVC